MKPNLPICCPPEAFNLLKSQLPTLETSDSLLNGAMAISMITLEDVAPELADAKIQGYADMILSRVRGEQPQAALAHLHALLFEEEGFVGNLDDYYGSANSYLPVVLETKRGLPITLSLIYKLVAERIGLDVWGIGLPGHFMAGVKAPHEGTAMIVDCFSAGRILTVPECHDRLRDLFGDETEWSDDFLDPISYRHWLTRMLQNLLRVFGANDQYAQVASVLEMEMLLWPDQEHLKRDLALVLARIGMAQPASAWLDVYLEKNPDDPNRLDLEQLRAVLLT